LDRERDTNGSTSQGILRFGIEHAAFPIRVDAEGEFIFQVNSTLIFVFGIRSDEDGFGFIDEVTSLILERESTVFDHTVIGVEHGLVLNIIQFDIFEDAFFHGEFIVRFGPLTVTEGRAGFKVQVSNLNGTIVRDDIRDLILWAFGVTVL
jgi:hypothetical protein